MKIEVIPAEKSQKSVLMQLMELYNHDLSEYTKEDVNEHGLFGYSYIDLYWIEERRYPFFIKVDGCFAGFVLVGTGRHYSTNENAHCIAEFFIMLKYRRMNVGEFAARYVFDLFAGEWEVRVLSANKPALPFWRKVITKYTNGNHIFHPEPTPDWDGVGYVFIA
ncbi:MAG: GNAT family N-acetyltransferase [Defluviitaleaceae bacterium]|nr:GNAT family N-acetyltransferase [Defluviitaleaceae bacterium]